MHAVLGFIETHAPYLIEFKYFFLFLGGAIEGMNTLVLGGFLASVGQVKLWLIIPLLIGAHTINGYLWYTVGYFGGAKALDRWGHKSKLSHQIINTIEDHFKRYSGRAIMFSKFTFSLEITTMILSGSLKYNLRKFSKYNFYGSVGWVLMAVFVGYFFGQGFKLFFSIIKNFTILLVFLGGAIAIIYLIKIWIKKYYVRYLYIQKKVNEWREKLRHGLDDFLSNGDKE